MDELRWFLLILGLLVIALVILYSRWQDWRQDGPPWRRRRRAKTEPFAEEGLDDDLRGDLEELDTLITEQRTEAPVGSEASEGVVGPSRRVGETTADTSAPEPEPAAEPDDAPATEPSPAPHQQQLFDSGPEAAGDAAPAARSRTEGDDDPAQGGATRAARRSVSGTLQSRMRQYFGGDGATTQADAANPSDDEAPPEGEEKLVVLTVMAPDDAVFAGEALIPILEEAGLRFGEHNIYHRSLATQQGTVSLYSVANIVEPGCLDREHMADYTTPGVALFMQLPGPFDGLAAFEQMLHTARTLADRLGGQLLDSRRCDLTQQSIEHIREELVEYRRRARLAARRAR